MEIKNELTSIECIKSKIDGLLREVNASKSRVDAAVKNTKKFLEVCRKNKVYLLSIGMKSEKIKSSINWPFETDGSIFSDDKQNHDGWPTIWKCVEDFGISTGCGNTGQRNADTSKLIDGVYELKKGKWMKIK